MRELMTRWKFAGACRQSEAISSPAAGERPTSSTSSRRQNSSRPSFVFKRLRQELGQCLRPAHLVALAPG